MFAFFAAGVNDGIIRRERTVGSAVFVLFRVVYVPYARRVARFITPTFSCARARVIIMRVYDHAVFAREIEPLDKSNDHRHRFCPQEPVEGVVFVGVQTGTEGTRERPTELRGELQEDGVAEQRWTRGRGRGRRTAR